MGFVPQLKPPPQFHPKGSLYFLIKDQHIIVRCDRDQYWIPQRTEILSLNLDLQPARYIGLWNGYFCYALEIRKDVSVTGELRSISQRDAFTQLPSAAVRAIVLAKQILTWDRNYRFCGQCGEPTVELPDERAKICKACGLTNYPRLSPSIIVSVVRDTHILLARSQRFPTGMYSVLAGFVEPGETLEECVHREVTEEVGVEVKNINYFGSQNWPFPHSLMIGFTAEYAGGEINIDNHEIVDARWFTAAELPKIPGSYSIARKLIDHFCDRAS